MIPLSNSIQIPASPKKTICTVMVHIPRFRMYQFHPYNFLEICLPWLRILAMYGAKSVNTEKS